MSRLRKVVEKRRVAVHFVARLPICLADPTSWRSLRGQPRKSATPLWKSHRNWRIPEPRYFDGPRRSDVHQLERCRRGRGRLLRATHPHGACERASRTRRSVSTIARPGGRTIRASLSRYSAQRRLSTSPWPTVLCRIFQLVNRRLANCGLLRLAVERRSPNGRLDGTRTLGFVAPAARC